MDIFQAASEGVPPEAATPEDIARFVVGAAVHAPSVHNVLRFGATGETAISVRRPVAEVLL